MFKKIFKEKHKDFPEHELRSPADFSKWLGKGTAFSKVRLELGKYFMTKFNGTVKYGPFAGYKFPHDEKYKKRTNITTLFGLYEQEVLGKLIEASRTANLLINLGAGDGYYSVASVRAGLFEKAICYEKSRRMRKTIEYVAVQNNVSEYIDIRAKANPAFFEKFSSNELVSSVVMIDIEGGEFEIVNRAFLKAFNLSTIIIEIHDFMVEDGANRLRKLEDYIKSADTHELSVIKSGARDLSIFPELTEFHDDIRWLLCSEGRAQLMQWWVLSPRREKS